MYHVKEEQMFWEERLLGPADALYVDGNQKSMCSWLHKQALPLGWPEVIIKQLPTADYLFRSIGGLICGVEAKMTDDWLTSFDSRRLQRQGREMIHGCDVYMLGLELGQAHLILPSLSGEILVGLVKWQVLGGFVILLPYGPRKQIEFLLDIRATLQEGRSLLSIISGDDFKRPASDLAPCALALQRMFKNIGPKIAVGLDNRFEGDIIRALLAPDEEWRAQRGVGPGILKERKKLMEKHDT